MWSRIRLLVLRIRALMTGQSWPRLVLVEAEKRAREHAEALAPNVREIANELRAVETRLRDLEQLRKSETHEAQISRLDVQMAETERLSSRLQADLAPRREAMQGLQNGADRLRRLLDTSDGRRLGRVASRLARVIVPGEPDVSSHLFNQWVRQLEHETHTDVAALLEDNNRGRGGS